MSLLVYLLEDAYFECGHALSAGDMEAIASQGEVSLRNCLQVQ